MLEISRRVDCSCKPLEILHHIEENQRRKKKKVDFISSPVSFLPSKNQLIAALVGFIVRLTSHLKGQFDLFFMPLPVLLA